MATTANKNQSPVSKFLATQTSGLFSKQVLFVLSGTILLALLAHLQVHLPFTPVPITGQTLGVALISLTWGALAPWTLLTYLTLGFLGAPMFANAASAVILGPTSGYLFGMLAASLVVGYLVERGFMKGFWSALGLAYIGSLCIFAVGLPVLAHFVGAKHVLVAGLFPFVLGDFLKNVSAATVVSRLKK